ncbi:flavodoxin [Lachnospiraceae bacterium KM106-2]|nr:flavodoxin [Lachnospiraceae bacterium KM106-2]
MEQVKVIYWTQTGNTEMMAGAIAEGIKQAGKEAVLLEVGNCSVADLEQDSIFVLGCPAMGAEELEETEMEPFMAELESHLTGKKVALFGSYGWGDGQWMRDWAERIENAGASVIGGEGLIVNETPEDDGLTSCRNFGEKIASN